MIVMKFGGTSVGSAERFRQVAQLIGSYSNEKPIAVVSAMNSSQYRTTNWLLATAQTLASSRPSDPQSAEKLVADLQAQYKQIIGDTIDTPNIQQEVYTAITAQLQQLVRLFMGIELLGEVSPRSLDAIAAFGEKLSSHVLAGALNDIGYKAQAVSTEQLVVTDRHFTAAVPFMPETTERCRAALLPMVEQGIIPVVTGFIGATEDGITTTLGRGGSDYSASIIGAALDAREIWIWTDVDGVMTADPRLVPTARSLRRISYAEAGELSYFGGKVIHPLTVIPAVEKGIPLYIKNTFNPDFPGTLIDAPREHTEGVVKAVTSSRDLSLLTVAGSGMVTVPGIAARAFARVAEQGVNVMMISHASSGHDLCFVIEQKATPAVIASLQKEFGREVERKAVESITADDDVVIIAVVGAGMRGSPGVAGRLFSTLGRKAINVIAIAQGSSELNISIIVATHDEKNAVAAIHDEFISLNGIGKSQIRGKDEG